MASGTLIVHGQEVPVPFAAVNYTDPSNAVIHFQPAATRDPSSVDEIVLHETAGTTHAGTVSTLLQRHLGIHFIVGEDGVVYQHADPADDMVWHASQHSVPSVGIELVNPYYPAHMPNGGPWTTVIDAPWADKGKYVVPTPAQAEADAQLVAALLGQGVLRIPRTWVGLRNGKMALGRLSGGGNLSPGVWAHMYFGHADGSWLALYTWMRLVLGLPADVAYREAIRRSTGTTVADVRDLVGVKAVGLPVGATVLVALGLGASLLLKRT